MAKITKKYNTPKNIEDKIKELNTNISAKVEKVDGMGLSQENFTTEIKNKVDTLENYDDTEIKEKINKKAFKSYISYEEFGAIGDGITDDGEAIKNAHEYANENNLSIFCPYNKKYYIKDAKNIIVNTNVDFNNSTIIFDEMYASKEPIFKFITEEENLTTEELSFLQNNLSKNVGRYESVKTFNGYVVKVEDNSCVICNRELGGGIEKQYYKEVFAVNYDGSIMCVNYQNPNDFGATLTIGTKYKIPKEILSFKNCNFTLTGNSDSIYTSYHRYIHIGRSNVVIENINVEVENDTGKIQRMFFRNENTFNVVFRNIKAPDFENKTSYSSSTYVFSNMNTISSKYYNINTPIYNPNFWGCFQSFYTKNLIIADSNISRFDSHFYGSDIIINNSNFGYKAIQLQGYGDIKFNNCTVNSYTFINFRDDYGSTWDGNIYINNCKLLFKNTSSNNIGSIIRHTNTSTFDYGYDCKIPNIFIKNFTFESAGKMENSICIDLSNSTGMTDTRYIKMSDIIDIDTIITDKNIKIIKIQGDYINPNKSKINIKNVNNLSKPISLYTTNTGFVGIESINKPTNYYQPIINIENCENISIGCKNSNCEINIRNCSINRINTLENSASDEIDKLNIENSVFNMNCSSAPTSGMPINKFISKDTFFNNVYFNSLKVNDVENENGNLIFFCGLFNSTNDDLIIETSRVVINSSMAGFSNISSNLKAKLKFNLI